MKRIWRYGLAVVAIVSLLASIWWGLPRAAERGFGPAFFISAGIFLLVFVAIIFRWMHDTAAALLGATAVWLVHFVGPPAERDGRL